MAACKHADYNKRYTHHCITVNSHRIKVSVLARHDFLRQRSVPDGFCLAFPPRKERNRVMKTIILNIFSRILKLCRCVFLLDVYLFYVLMYVLQEIFPPWHIPFKLFSFTTFFGVHLQWVHTPLLLAIRR